MIVQFLQKPRDGISSFRRACEYAIFGKASERDHIDPYERVLFSGTRNLESTQFNLDGSYDVSDIWDEMASTTRRNSRCKDPVEHVVMSWPTGEVPTQRQFAEAVEIFA